ncbi:MAG: GtrA family protein [Boseongicola sp.]|nr:GtrA family protein [Boseongicola sp.]
MSNSTNTLTQQLARFATVGALNTVIGVAVIFACYQLFDLGLTLSNAIGYGTGLVISFALNGAWTFGSSQYNAPAIAKFLVIVAIGFFANLAAINLLMALAVPYTIAQLFGVCTYSALVFLGMKYAIFKE